MRRNLPLPPTASGVLDVLRFLPRVSVRLTVLAAVLTAANSALPLLLTVLTGLLIGSIPPAAVHGLRSPQGTRAMLLFGLAAVVILAQRVLAPLASGLAMHFGRLVDRHLQDRVLAAVNRPAGIAHLENPAILNLVTTSQGVGSHGARPGQSVPALVSLIPSWVASWGSAAVLFWFHWWLGLLWVLLWPVALWTLQREYLRVGAIASGHADAVRRASYYRDLALLPGPGKEIRTLNLPSWIQQRFHDTWMLAMTPIWASRSPVRPTIWAAVAAVGVASLGTFLLLAHAAVTGALGLTSLALFTRATMDAATFRAFDDANMDLAHATLALPALLALERAVDTDAGSIAATAALPEDSPRDEIVFDRVSFRYPHQDHNVLDNLDLRIPAGRSIAIVGLNGAGKTTLVKLLCGLYPPSAGRILVDGTDLRQVAPEAWQRRLAAIFQDFIRYHLTARENITAGAWVNRDNDAAVRGAAEAAGAVDLIGELPREWDTLLSRQYTDGSDLSGGQWQRIALARALFAVRGGATVLILDEPSANLDVRAEAELYDRFLDLTRGLTTVLISHRFSTVRRADTIVVLEQGRVVEQGDHDQLMALDGRYAAMFRLQADRFEDSEEVRSA